MKSRKAAVTTIESPDRREREASLRELHEVGILNDRELASELAHLSEAEPTAAGAGSHPIHSAA